MYRVEIIINQEQIIKKTILWTISKEKKSL